MASTGAIRVEVQLDFAPIIAALRALADALESAEPVDPGAVGRQINEAIVKATGSSALRRALGQS